MLEHTSLREAVDPVPEGAHMVEIGRARLAREGERMTLITHGAAVPVVEAAVEELELDADVIDLRTLQPLDDEAVLTSVRRTGTGAGHRTGRRRRTGSPRRSSHRSGSGRSSISTLLRDGLGSAPAGGRRANGNGLRNTTWRRSRGSALSSSSIEAGETGTVEVTMPDTGLGRGAAVVAWLKQPGRGGRGRRADLRRRLGRRTRPR